MDAQTSSELNAVSGQSQPPPYGTSMFTGAHGFRIEQQNNVVGYTSATDLCSLLNPIPDASFARDRRVSPPDSHCLPGTRQALIKRIQSWGAGNHLSLKPSELELSRSGFTDRDLEDEITLGPHFATEGKKTMRLRDIISICKRFYPVAVGYHHGITPSTRSAESPPIHDRLIWSESFERFIASKYPNEKRFGLEGCEALISGVKALIDRTVIHGVKHITMGIPRCGRLNVLANVIRNPIEAILNEFNCDQDETSPAGDVKYRLDANYVRPTLSGKKVSFSLVTDPSHLEAQDSVVVGKTCAIQHVENGAKKHNTAMDLLHGDAAFASQGVVYEILGFHSLPVYGTGCTLHLIANNEIGFTTNPRFSCSTHYPSDLAKSIDAHRQQRQRRGRQHRLLAHHRLLCEVEGSHRWEGLNANAVVGVNLRCH
ncbi:hypothetical protein NMY22_g8194 [Coprinellus aureogranulatus]|nr:hypothetical protein NMY22_g8194 [Coprinellus aureogranulatus]